MSLNSGLSSSSAKHASTSNDVHIVPPCCGGREGGRGGRGGRKGGEGGREGGEEGGRGGRRKEGGEGGREGRKGRDRNLRQPSDGTMRLHAVTN